MRINRLITGAIPSMPFNFDLTKLNFDNPNNSLKIINQIKIMFEQEQNFNKRDFVEYIKKDY